MNTRGKLLIFSAPSGSGKTTLVKRVMNLGLPMEFSVSATSRSPREGEVDGKDYYFISPDEFKRKIANDEFLEWEEVYPDQYYGTLKSVVEQKLEQGKHVVFDVDVVGGLNIKKAFGDDALAIFIKAPSLDELKKRLTARGTESAEALAKRLGKAEQEMAFAPHFDVVVVNDELERAVQQTYRLIHNFIHGKKS